MQPAEEDSVPALKDLRQKCEQAPRYGVNGRYLILQAARSIAHKEQQQQEAGGSGGCHLHM